MTLHVDGKKFPASSKNILRLFPSRTGLAPASSIAINKPLKIFEAFRLTLLVWKK
jgi:hypothetical protein